MIIYPIKYDECKKIKILSEQEPGLIYEVRDSWLFFNKIMNFLLKSVLTTNDTLVSVMLEELTQRNNYLTLNWTSEELNTDVSSGCITDRNFPHFSYLS